MAKILSIFKYLLFLGLGIFLVWWSVHKIPDDKIPEFENALRTARYWMVVPVFFILMASHLLRAVRWRILMQPMGYRPSLLNVFFAVMIGYLANLAVPRLGEVLKCTILARYDKVPAEKLVGTIVAERAFDLLFLIIIFIIAFIVQYDVVMHFTTSLFGDSNVSFTKIAMVGAALALLAWLVRTVLQRNRHHSIVASVQRILRGVWHGLSSAKDLQSKVPFLLTSIGIWALYIFGTWLGFQATEGTAGLGVDVAISALAFGSIGMILTPGGFGSYAFFLALIMQRNGVAQEIALANGNLQWFAQFLIVLVIGFMSLGLLPYFNKKPKPNDQSQPAAR